MMEMQIPDGRLVREFTSRPLFREKGEDVKGDLYPLLSVVTPSYNQGAFLERTIRSVLNQGYPNLEFIIIDGGSTDNSVEIIRRYESRLAYWISEKDRGQSDALNKGFRKATGEIVGWQNSDDIYLPGAFFAAAEAFRRHPEADFFYGNRLDLDGRDEVIGETRFTKFSRLVYQYDGISLGTQSMFFRRPVLARVGFLDTELCFAMDYEWFLRAACQGCRFCRIPAYLGAMRRHGEAKTEAGWDDPRRLGECRAIDGCHGRILALNGLMKIYGLLFRTLHYLVQGDGDYVFRGVIRRLRRGSLLSGE
jgi:glycosyltransferase involved in cell wall biosynthesis